MINVRDQQNLLLNIARKLKQKLLVYAVGGTAMMFHGLKDVTLDINLVFTSEEDRNAFKLVAEELEYKLYNHTLVYGTKSNPPLMLRRGKGDEEERFDLFTIDVIDFIFSAEMMKRAKNTYEFDQKLILKIADPHDIILMKCATERVKDKDDTRQIMDNYNINWDIIINEAINQIKFGREKAIWYLTGFITDIKKIGGKIPSDVLPTLYRLLEKQGE